MAKIKLYYRQLLVGLGAMLALVVAGQAGIIPSDVARLASLDVMELNPALDVRNQTAVLAVDFIRSLFGASTLAR